MSKFIYLAGNISEGFEAYGPMDSFDDVCEIFDGMEGWVMELKDPESVRPTPASDPIVDSGIWPDA